MALVRPLPSRSPASSRPTAAWALPRSSTRATLPSTFNENYEGLVPGKTVAVCFKPNQTQLANGSLDASITKYVNSIPAGWTVMLVNWQEPDDEMWKDQHVHRGLSTGLPPTD